MDKAAGEVAIDSKSSALAPFSFPVCGIMMGVKLLIFFSSKKCEFAAWIAVGFLIRLYEPVY